MRLLQPADGILAFYDGREDHRRSQPPPHRPRRRHRGVRRLRRAGPGDPDVIAAGGDDVGIIEAMRVYPRALLAGDRRPVREILEGALRHGWSTGTRPMRPCTR